MSDLILTVDVGNTATTCGIFEDEGLLRALFSFKTEYVVSPEELLIKVNEFLSLFGIKIKDIKGLSLACVVPPVEVYWVELGKKWLAREVVVASAKTVGIPLDLHYSAEVGADRLVNALGGWIKYKSSLIIVDFGTAITFDCISSEGVYLGGAISPGLTLSMEALFKGTAKLPRIDLSSPPEKAIGKDTISALKSGLLFGFAGLTDTMIEKLTAEMLSNPLVIATGGLASFIAPLSKKIQKIDPTLTLDGLFYLWKNR
ncbi:Baf family transcriptional regulator [Caldimicrobium thiodismutans]|jgi:type III pantothenate kinase|uniref:Type III pantothenate kinase n=1 Tax=Caldimicrobium thiodismutans TaxID=1653476 RepID=A0A0U5B729_9BACT|nr:type III pantothenate kinase [Caldimicrobium thiodismutans]BAU23872.1 Baf family transcriptional regulator [Caldimicrobium thiodismutans]